MGAKMLELGINAKNLFDIENKANGKYVWESNPELIQNLPGSSLRIFGGLSSFGYHPNGTGMGYIDAEVPVAYRNRHKHEEKNFKERHVEAVKAMPKFKNAAYVHNVKSNPKECVDLIKFYKANGIRVNVVELGNEYNLPHPDKQTGIDMHWVALEEKTGESDPTKAYIKWAAGEIDQIKEALPEDEIDFIVVAPNGAHNLVSDYNDMTDKQKKKRDAWNQAVGDAIALGELNADGIVCHNYMEAKHATDLTKEQDRIDAMLYMLKRDTYADFETSVIDYYKKYYGFMPIHITEWGIKDPSNPNGFGNTMIEGMWTTEYMLNILRANKEYNNRIHGAYYFKGFNFATNGAVSVVDKDKDVITDDFKAEADGLALSMFDEDMEWVSSERIDNEIRVDKVKLDDQEYMIYVNYSENNIMKAGGATKVIESSSHVGGVGRNWYCWDDKKEINSDYKPIMSYTEEKSTFPAISFGKVYLGDSVPIIDDEEPVVVIPPAPTFEDDDFIKKLIKKFKSIFGF